MSSALFEQKPKSEELIRVVAESGAKGRYRAYAEGEPGRYETFLETRRPVKIMPDGSLSGTEVSLWDKTIWRVWTDKVRLAKALLKGGLTGYLADGEAVLYVPGGRADELLPKFGVKVRRQGGKPSPAQIKARERFSQMRSTVSDPVHRVVSGV